MRPCRVSFPFFQIIYSFYNFIIMKNLHLKLPDWLMLQISTATVLKKAEPLLLFLIFLTVWAFAPGWLRMADETVGNVDQSIWLLVLLSLICFLLIFALCWWLVQRFWVLAGLPPFLLMVSQFNTLQLWQQLSFYWLSFVTLLLAAMGSLMAIC
jgi:hypothetical protein